MALRAYISPWVGAGTPADPYRAKALEYAPGRAFFPSNLDGTPASPWVLSFLRSGDWTAITADPECDDLFAGDLPEVVQDRASFLGFLRGRTVADVPLARRNAIIAVLDKYAIPRADLTGATPLWKVVQRVAATLYERDANFGSAF